MRLNLVLVVSSAVLGIAAPPAQLNGHTLKLDANGNIETWLPNATAQHDFVTRAMAYVDQLPADPTNRMPAWMTHGQVPFYNNAHNPASLFGGWAQVAAAFKAYTGDDVWMDRVGEMLSYLLANGTTPTDATWAYPSIPYASSDPGSVRYRGAADWDDFHADGDYHKYNPIGRGDGYGVVEPDKVGMVGTAYLLLWRHNPQRYADFLRAALECASTLAKTMNTGANETHSPWPFRVYAETGIVRQAYSSHVLFNIQLFDQLLALNSTAAPQRLDPTARAVLQQARDRAWSWLVEYPLANGNWCGFCEDITLEAEQWQTYKNATYVTPAQCNYDSIQPLLLAQYLLQRRDNPALGLDWKVHVPALISFVERKLVFWEKPGPNGPDPKTQPAVQFGARCVSEQRADPNRMSCHTTRYASTLKQYADAIQGADPAAAAAALAQSQRSWAWASYCLTNEGMVTVTPGVGAAGLRTWFSVTIPSVGDTLAIMGFLPPVFP